MIKIEKDLNQIPNSLKVPPVNQTGRTTHQKRQEIIANGAYISNSSYNKRYKMADVKKALFDIYNGKCAFCEQRVERFDVEHFRPKSIYFWLAYSWDNLLYACPGCNGSKSDNFEIDGQRADQVPADLSLINASSEALANSEQPRFFNPEKDDPSPHLNFQEDGLIHSDHRQLSYTITTCEVDRPYLNDDRKKIWDDFVKDLESEVLEATDRNEAQNNVMVLVRKFRRDAELNPKNQFLAFRRYAIRHFLVAKLQELLA